MGMNIEPVWIGIGVSALGVGSGLVISAVKISERIFSTKQEVAALEKATAEAMARIKEDTHEKVTAVSATASEKLAKAVEDRRRDVAAVESLLRADHAEKMNAIECRLLTAIKESKEDRKREAETLWAKLDMIDNYIRKPRTLADTHALPREVIR